MRDIKENKNNPYKLDFYGSEDNLKKGSKAFICIADNSTRKRIYTNCKNADFDINLIHPNSNISTSIKKGHQILICAGAIINSQAKIGNGCILNTGSIIEHECIVGDFSHIAPGATLCGNVETGENCFIGANSVVKQGVKIGKNVTIGAGSVVINNISDNSKVVGNPTRHI